MMRQTTMEVAKKRVNQKVRSTAAVVMRMVVMVILRMRARCGDTFGWANVWTTPRLNV